jgi:hypothetical protein
MPIFSTGRSRCSPTPAPCCARAGRRRPPLRRYRRARRRSPPLCSRDALCPSCGWQAVLLAAAKSACRWSRRAGLVADRLSEVWQRHDRHWCMASRSRRNAERCATSFCCTFFSRSAFGMCGLWLGALFSLSCRACTHCSVLFKRACAPARVGRAGSLPSARAGLRVQAEQKENKKPWCEHDWRGAQPAAICGHVRLCAQVVAAWQP